MAEKSKPIRNIESAERNKLGYSRTRITVKTKSGNNMKDGISFCKKHISCPFQARKSICPGAFRATTVLP